MNNGSKCFPEKRPGVGRWGEQGLHQTSTVRIKLKGGDQSQKKEGTGGGGEGTAAHTLYQSARETNRKDQVAAGPGGTEGKHGRNLLGKKKNTKSKARSTPAIRSTREEGDQKRRAKGGKRGGDTIKEGQKEDLSTIF